jgi:hypothetical protein
VQKCAFERQPLPHAAREASGWVVSLVEARTFECRLHEAIDVTNAVRPGKECQILRCRQLGIDEEIVAEDADSRP